MVGDLRENPAVGYSIRFSLMTTLGPSTPPEVLGWIRECTAGQSAEPAFEVLPVAAPMVKDASWLLSVASVTIAEAWRGREGTAWNVSVQIADLNDEGQGGTYGLAFLMAPFSDDGLLAVSWTDMTPDVEPTLFLVQDGVPWVSGYRCQPVPAIVGEPPADLVWRLGVDTPNIEDLERLGVPNPHAARAAEASTGQPLLARHLLSRSVVRALRDLDVDQLATGAALGEQERARLRAAAEAGARLALEVVEAGGDPLLVKDTPGWQLQEVQARSRYLTTDPRGSGRLLTGLAASLDEVGPGGIDAGPKRLVEGETITTLAPVTLSAHGPLIWAPDGRSATAHHLHVDVPRGERLVLTKVYEKGHAECRPVGSDLAAWLRSNDHFPDQPGELIAPPEEYTVGWINPQDEGRLFQREHR